MGHIAGSNEAGGQGIYTRVKCFPLFSLMLAFNHTTINFLSLDLEGVELQVGICKSIFLYSVSL